MKYSVICVTQSSGKAKASGEPFSMARLIAVIPVELADSPKYKCIGAGFTPLELEVSDDFIAPLIAKFSHDFKGQAVVYDLDVLVRQRGLSMVVGFTGAKQPRSAIPPQPQSANSNQPKPV